MAVIEAAMALLSGSGLVLPLLAPRLREAVTAALSVAGAELVRWYGRVGVEGCEPRLRDCSNDEKSPSPPAEKSALLVGV